MLTAAAEASWPVHAPAPSRLRARAFARVEALDSFEAAADSWAEITKRASASPYQSLPFSRAWTETFGLRERVKLLIVVARGEADDVVALLPLGLRRRGPAVVASFLGGRCANYHMGWFAPGFAWSREDIAKLLREAAAAARPRIDVFNFINQPRTWEGLANPLAAFPSPASPSNAFASALPPVFETWFGAHFSKSTQKKLRKKAKKFEAIGEMRRDRALNEADARLFLKAFLAQRRATAKARRQYNEFDEFANIQLLERLTGLTGDPPAMELHALRAGGRIVAVFGAIVDARRMSGMVISHDPDPVVASSSPGEWLVIEVVRDAIQRGFETFDLGIGEARYKSECCEIVEPLFDCVIPTTPLGRMAAPGLLWMRALKRHVKKSPRLTATINRWLARVR